MGTTICPTLYHDRTHRTLHPIILHSHPKTTTPSPFSSSSSTPHSLLLDSSALHATRWPTPTSMSHSSFHTTTPYNNTDSSAKHGDRRSMAITPEHATNPRLPLNTLDSGRPPSHQPGPRRKHPLWNRHLWMGSSASRSIRIRARVARIVLPRRPASATYTPETEHHIDQINESHDEDSHAREERNHANPKQTPCRWTTRIERHGIDPTS